MRCFLILHPAIFPFCHNFGDTNLKEKIYLSLNSIILYFFPKVSPHGKQAISYLSICPDWESAFQTKPLQDLNCGNNQESPIQYPRAQINAPNQAIYLVLTFAINPPSLAAQVLSWSINQLTVFAAIFVATFLRAKNWNPKEFFLCLPVKGAWPTTLLHVTKHIASHLSAN